MTTERLCPVEVLLRLRDNNVTQQQAHQALVNELGRTLLCSPDGVNSPRVELLEQALDLLEFK